MIITDNVVEDASVAFQLYSQSHEFVIANNHSMRTGGSYSHATDFLDSKNGRRYSYSLFNQWIGNVFEEGLVYDQGSWTYGYVGLTTDRSTSLWETTSAIGNRFEGNLLQAGTQLGATSSTKVPAATLAQPVMPVGRDTIFEKNLVAAQPNGITLDPGYWFTLLRKNHFPGVLTPVRDRATETAIQQND